MLDPQDERELASLAWTMVIGLWVAALVGSVGRELVRVTGVDVAVSEFMDHACSGDLPRPSQAPAAVGP